MATVIGLVLGGLAVTVIRVCDGLDLKDFQYFCSGVDDDFLVVGLSFGLMVKVCLSLIAIGE
ncbi:hypothetical protein Hanom_Chr16g01472491 [Helianthus anomalus]